MCYGLIEGAKVGKTTVKTGLKEKIFVKQLLKEIHLFTSSRVYRGNRA